MVVVGASVVVVGSWGEDLRPGLPPTKPSAAVAAGFHVDTHAVLARARQTLGTSTDPEVIQRMCRMAARRMVQVAFAVVMARKGVWSTVLEEQAAAVGAAFPPVVRGRTARRRAGAAARRRCRCRPGAAGQLWPLGRGRTRPGGVGGEQPARSSAMMEAKHAAARPTGRLPTRQVVTGHRPHLAVELVTIAAPLEPRSS